MKSSEAMILAVMNAIFAIREVQRIVEWKGVFFFDWGGGGVIDTLIACIP